MTGSLQTKHGKYYVVTRISDGTGGTKTKWINTGIPTEGNNKRRAQQRRIEILAELEENKDLISADMLFTDWLDSWLKKKRDSIRLNTVEGYELYINKHIRPYFSEKKLTVREITTQDIQGYYKKKLSEGQSPNSIRKHHAVIHGALDEAVNQKMIRANPSNDVKLPKREVFEGTAYSIEDAEKLLSVLDTEIIKPAVILGLYYGLRRSEVCGLRWDDINFEAGTMTVRNTVVQMKTLIEHEETKSTKSKRTLALVGATIPYLQSLKAEQDKLKALMGDRYPDPMGHICTHKNGKPFLPGYISHRFLDLLRKYNLPEIRFHDLRHTAGSLLMEQGATIKQVQECLGHEKASTTADIYLHVSMRGKQAVAQMMDGIFTKC